MQARPKAGRPAAMPLPQGKALLIPPAPCNLPVKRPCRAGFGISALFCPALIGSAASFTSALQQSRDTAFLFVGFVACSAFLPLLGFLPRCDGLCSLCNVTGFLVSLYFPCYYCGNTFNFLKPTK